MMTGRIGDIVMGHIHFACFGGHRQPFQQGRAWREGCGLNDRCCVTATKHGNLHVTVLGMQLCIFLLIISSLFSLVPGSTYGLSYLSLLTFLRQSTAIISGSRLILL
jgi:hypothetical protein